MADKASGGPLADYDFRLLGRLLRLRLDADGRGWRALAAEIGVTSPDLSRLCSGQPVSSPKTIAVCDWLHVEHRAFYRPAGSSASQAFSDEPARETPKMFHGESSETAEAACSAR